MVVPIPLAMGVGSSCRDDSPRRRGVTSALKKTSERQMCTVRFNTKPDITTFAGVPDARPYRGGRIVANCRPVVFTKRYFAKARRHAQIAVLIA